MPSISSLLAYIGDSIYGSQVRSSIVAAIQQCYEDVNNPTLLTTGINSIISSKVADGTISDRIITDIGVLTEPTDNLFDFSNVTQGLLNTSSGTVDTTNTNYWTSTYIPVTAGNTYYFTNTFARVFYNSSKTTATNIGQSSFTPSTDGYIRVSVTDANRMKAMIKETSGGTYIPGRSAIDYNLRANTYNKGQVDALLAGVDVSLTSAQKSELIGLLDDSGGSE